MSTSFCDIQQLSQPKSAHSASQVSQIHLAPLSNAAQSIQAYDAMTFYFLDAAVRYFIIASFKMQLNALALNTFDGRSRGLEIAESWILIEIIRNEKNGKRLDQLFTVAKIDEAVNRYLEFEFYGKDFESELGSSAFRIALERSRGVCGIKGGEQDSKRAGEEDKAHSPGRNAAETIFFIATITLDPPKDTPVHLLPPVPQVLAPHSQFFSEIESLIKMGVLGPKWKVEKRRWKDQIQRAYDLFHARLLESVTLRVKSDSFASIYTNFIETHPYPYHLLRHISPIELANRIQQSNLSKSRSSSGTKAGSNASKRHHMETLSEGEYANYVNVIVEYCAEGGHPRAIMDPATRNSFKDAHDNYQNFHDQLHFMTTETYVAPLSYIDLANLNSQTVIKRN
jgi:hypothetical protein